MVKKYVKGANAERKLANIFKDKGFVTIRSAGSGSSISTPDLVAIKRGLILAFEIKSWATKPHLTKKETEMFKNWCEVSGGMGFFVWRKTGGDWVFLDIKKYNGGVMRGGISLEEFLFNMNF